MADRLNGKRAFITAAGQGMGRAAAVAFAQEGATVWATDVNANSLGALEGARGITTRVLDGTIMECSEQDWDTSFGVNVKSMYRVTRALLPGMLKQGRGSIINMASIASSIRGIPNRFVYGATKAAVLGLTKSIAADYVKQGIRCNAVCPGTVDTPSLQDRINALPDPVEARKQFIARQPMGRLGTTDDIVPLLIYLASDESSFATGVAFSVDGGMTI